MRMRMMLNAATVLAMIAAAQPPTQPSTPMPDEAEPEARSLLGRPLFALKLPPEKEAQAQQNLTVAQEKYQADPSNEEAIIWLGRRLAYLGRYSDAIDVFTRGLDIHPNSAALLRHRGHRFITTRNFELAMKDLTRAAELIADTPDVVEPDGQPNVQNQPTGTLHTNIFYHLGLAHYLRGQFEPAAAAYRRCLDAAKNDDMRVAATHWLYMTLRRLKQDDAAAALLEPISASMNIIENTAYHHLLLMYKGERPVDSMLEGIDPESIDFATIAYGAGVWQLCAGQAERAQALFEKVLAGPMWPAFGHIAAEAEMRRLRDTVLGISAEQDREILEREAESESESARPK